MSTISPPSHISFDEDHHPYDDDGDSMLANPIFDSDEECVFETDDVGIELNADPYFYHILEKKRSTSKKNQKQQQQQKQEDILELKIQMMRQEEKIHALTSLLTKVRLENQMLTTEKISLENEVANGFSSQQPSSSNISFQENNATDSSVISNCISSDRSQLLLDIMRKSFKTYIKESRQCHQADSRTIKELQKENAMLKQQLALPKEIIAMQRSFKSQDDTANKKSLQCEKNDCSPKKASKDQHVQLPEKKNCVPSSFEKNFRGSHGTAKTLLETDTEVDHLEHLLDIRRFEDTEVDCLQLIK